MYVTTTKYLDMMERITQYNEHLSNFHSLAFMPLHN